MREKLEERRQLLGESVADYYYDILSFCSRLNLPKSEWLYCFVRGLRPEIRDHVILQQPTDVDSALNFARLKELVTLGKSKNGQEVEECSKFKSNPTKEDIKQILRDELNVWSETSQNNEKHRYGINRKVRSCNFLVHGEGTIFSKKPKLGRYRNFKPDFKRLHRRNNTQNVFKRRKIGVQLNWLAPLSCVVVNPWWGCLKNSTRNNHSSVGSSSFFSFLSFFFLFFLHEHYYIYTNKLLLQVHKIHFLPYIHK